MIAAAASPPAAVAKLATRKNRPNTVSPAPRMATMHAVAGQNPIDQDAYISGTWSEPPSSTDSSLRHGKAKSK